MSGTAEYLHGLQIQGIFFMESSEGGDDNVLDGLASQKRKFSEARLITGDMISEWVIFVNSLPFLPYFSCTMRWNSYKLSECITSRGGNIFNSDIFVSEHKNV
ncbi:uncharacterized protein [Coffea arabica]|uniref:Uncharacterized protein n=1 Tax=Coffea arabica TaxID=13443 RepID=A0ABM4WWH6_COFAR